MPSKTRDPSYSSKKRINISEINIALNTQCSASGFVNKLVCLLDDYSDRHTQR